MNAVTVSCSCVCFCRNEATSKIRRVTFAQFHTNISFYALEPSFSKTANLFLEICRIRSRGEGGITYIVHEHEHEHEHEHFSNISKNGE